MIRPATAVAGLFVVLALLIAPYLRPWVTQRAQISAAKQQVAELQADVTTLRAEQRRWEDDAFVEAQARQRLKYVFPGEIAYVMLDRGSTTTADPRTASSVVPQVDLTRPWYDTLWHSMETAGDPNTRAGSGAAGSAG